MFDGLARKFFWVTMASGVLAGGSGVFEAPQKVNAFVKEVRALREEMAHASNDRPRLNFGNVKPPDVNERDFEEAKTTIDNQQFVVIRGKYYRYRPDHIYMVNGQRLFFQNNREITKAPAGVKVAQADMKRDIASGAQAMPSESPQPIPKDVPLDDSVMSPTEALKKMRELQQQMQERNKFLESLDTSGQ